MGRKSFSVKAGKVKTVKVKLTRSARARLGDRGKLKVRVRSTGAKLGSQKLSAKTLVTLKD